MCMVWFGWILALDVVRTAWHYVRSTSFALSLTRINALIMILGLPQLGTCAMKPRAKGGVVDPKLNVYGVQGLKVCGMPLTLYS